jgi:hypothetical protein
MGANSSINQSPSVIAASSNNNDTGINDPSRLLASSANIRNSLYTRNLYTPNKEYPLDLSATAKVVGAISGILSLVAPFQTINLKDSLIGRAIADPTPLTEIGLVMLGKQFALTSMAHTEQQTFPQINLNIASIVKGGKLFTPNVNYKITKDQSQSGFQNFLETITFQNVQDKNPFSLHSQNSDFLANTGAGQLGFYYDQINYNLYKSNENSVYQNATRVDKKIFDRPNITSNRVYFDGNEKSLINFEPYVEIKSDDAAVRDANVAMRNAYDLTSTQNAKQEYAPNKDFVDKNLGRTENPQKIKISQTANDWVDPNDEFGNPSIDNTLIWGKDGISPKANNNINQLRGTSNNADQTVVSTINLPNGNFDARVGLLEYTRNLLNTKNGAIVDQTKKVFTQGNEKYVNGFNGSGLWVANNSKYIGENAGITGLRQHNVLDKYDKFAKAIRFNGNKLYSGNENSVVYNSVIPRIHPVFNGETGKIDNKNMMFSIENLAVNVIANDKYGIIDDEFGSPIPLCEVGPFNGRIMWFPPYNLEFNETTVAKYESTVMIGRSEPMYNYQNSERSAQFNFTLLVDYPPHVRNYKNDREMAEFFAFGGDDYLDQFISDDGFQLRINILEGKIAALAGPPNLTYTPETLNPRFVRMSFPNDEPIDSQITFYIDRLYKLCQYEIKEGCPSGSDNTCFGLNKDIFFVSGLTSGSTFGTYSALELPSVQFSQYSVDLPADQFGNIPLIDKILQYVYNDETNINLYDIVVYGGASKLYQHPELEATYNLALGQRRADALKDYIDARLTVLYGNDAEGLGITITAISKGSTEADPANATPEAIPLQATKEERYAEMRIVKNGNPVKAQQRTLTAAERQQIIDWQGEIEAIKVKMRAAKSNVACVMNERGSTGANGTKDSGILGGYKSITGNYFYPVFHSQTPEDFHKRLTFLHQCTRQGAAKRWNNPNDNDSNSSNLRARNSVFGRQPICILRLGDFFYTKVIIESVTVDYTDTTWDMNPEGFGMQPMLAKVSLQMKLIGGQSLKGPIDALQNAVSFNYYANSTYTNTGLYKLPSDQAVNQETYNKGITAEALNKKGQPTTTSTNGTK